MPHTEGFFSFNWKRFLRSSDDAANNFGVSATTLFWGVVFLSVGAAIFGWMYGRAEGMKKIEWGAIGFLLPWTVTFLVMLFRFFFVTPHKMHEEAAKKHADELAAKDTQIDELKAKTAINPELKMRIDKLGDFIVEFDLIKEDIENRNERGVSQFNKVNDECAEFVAKAFPNFHDYPSKPRPKVENPVRHNPQDFLTYEKKCDNALNALWRLKKYYT